jgi:hypothetical protein
MMPMKGFGRPHLVDAMMAARFGFFKYTARTVAILPAHKPVNALRARDTRCD